MIPVLAVILFILMLCVGGNRGLDSFLALVKTIAVMLIVVYLIAWGLPAVPVTLVSGILFAAIVLYGQNGRNRKMHAAALSVGIVLVVILLTAGPILWAAGISGYNEIEQYEEISMYLSANLHISMSAVSLSSVTLGLLGAIMDTAVAIATAVNEVHVNQPALTGRQLIHSGFRVGKDILGTTVNTLFFAGLGESIMLAVLFMKNGDSAAEIINSKALFQELSGILVGGIGCLFIIPLCSVLSAAFFTMDEPMEQDNLLQKCYKYYKYLLKFIKNMLK